MLHSPRLLRGFLLSVGPEPSHIIFFNSTVQDIVLEVSKYSSSSSSSSNFFREKERERVKGKRERERECLSCILFN